MLHSVKELRGLAIAATDGELGTIDDIYFDDRHWTIRYLVVDTGGWISGRKVLISPISLRGSDWADEVLRVDLTKQEIEDSPGIDSAKPVSRQHESALYDHYGYPYYWAGPYVWGYTSYPTNLADRSSDHGGDVETGARIDKEHDQDDPHLRSNNELAGYKVHATDDMSGRVEDFLFDDRSWSIQLIVVNTDHRWPEKDVLIPPQRIERVSWEEKQIVVNISRKEVEQSPEYDPAFPPPIEPQNEIYRRFGLPPP